jgi:hypothetical protein
MTWTTADPFAPRRIPELMKIAATTLLLLAGLTTAAHAADNRNNWDRQHLDNRGYYDNQHRWQRGYYRPPPPVIYAPPRYYPPPVVYSPPGIGLYFGIH